ncbi:hypothetical protein HAX54_049112, partial [Datura stramonium]|nr:hypothetical protein [Datura stramonium]
SVSVFAEDNPSLMNGLLQRHLPSSWLKISSENKSSFSTNATKNTAFSWLRNIFHDCFVESCDASLLLDSTRRMLSEKETDRSFGMRNFRYIETIKEAVERECPGVVSCADILVLSGRDGIVAVCQNWNQHSWSCCLTRVTQCGKNTLCEVGSPFVSSRPQLNPEHAHMLKKCPDPIPDPKAVQYVRNDRGTHEAEHNYYRNILDNKGLMLVDHQLAVDKGLSLCKENDKSQDYFFKEFSRAITILSENNPLTGTKGEIRKQSIFPTSSTKDPPAAFLCAASSHYHFPFLRVYNVREGVDSEK